MQRLARCHLALKTAIEIGRRVVAERSRPVLQHGLGMDDQAIEPHCVNKRLERRSGRAHGARHIDRSPPRHRVEIGASDIGEHSAVAVVDNHRSQAGFRIKAHNLPPQERFDSLLQQRIDRCAVARRRRLFVAQFACEMWCPERHCQASPRDLFRARLGKRAMRYHLLLGHAQQDAITRGAGRFGMPIGAKPLRGARDGDEQRRLGRGKPGRLLAEIGEAGGTDAFEIAAERRQGQVEAEHLVLRHQAFERQRLSHLAEFAQERTRVGFEQARCLHRQGRGTRDDAPADCALDQRARRGERIDTEVPGKAPILGGDQHAAIEWIDIIWLHRQAPLAVRRQKPAQNRTVGRKNEHRCTAAAIERWRGKKEVDDHRGGYARSDCRAEPAPHPPAARVPPSPRGRGEGWGEGLTGH